MPTVKYIGPHQAVEVPMPTGALATVAHGDSLETDGEHAAALLEQPSNWQAEKKAASHKPGHKAPADTPPGEEG